MPGPADDPEPRTADATTPGTDGVWVVVVAGGGGTRFGGPKQFVPLAGRRVLDWSVETARSVAEGVVVVLPAADLEEAVPPGADAVVAGGATRAASVRAGLDAVPPGARIVLVHDAARPAATPGLFRAVVAAVEAGAVGVVPGVAVTDSLRHRSGQAIDREPLVAVQTPQGFRAEALRSAHADGADASDDATLVERAGGTITVVDGEITNVKLTHPDDVVLLERVLGARTTP